MTSRRQRAGRAAELAVGRARYDAERAFTAVELENRLVARPLEARWEAMLVEAEQALAATTETPPPLPGWAELGELAADLPGLWHDPATTNTAASGELRVAGLAETAEPRREPREPRVGGGPRGHVRDGETGPGFGRVAGQLSACGRGLVWRLG